MSQANEIMVTIEETEQFTVTKRFEGRWLSGEDGLYPDDEDKMWMAGISFHAVQTKGGRIVILTDDRNSESFDSMEVFASIDDLDGKVPENVISAIANAIGESHAEVLNI